MNLRILILLILSLKIFNNANALSNGNDFIFQNQLLQNRKQYYFQNNRDYKYISLDINLKASKNINDLAKIIDKDDEKYIIKYINNNLGNRHQIISNNFLSFQYKDIEFSYNIGGSVFLDMNNPIINEIDLNVIRKESFNLEKIFNYKDLTIIPTLIYGKRSIVNQKIFPSDFLDDNFDIAVDQEDYNHFLDFNLRVNKQIKSDTILSSEIEGLNLINKDYNYWRINTAIQKRLISNSAYTLNGFIKISPLYAGTYDPAFLYEIGLEQNFYNRWKIIPFIKHKGFHLINEFDLFFIKLRGEYSNSYITPNSKEEQLKLNLNLFF